MQARLKPRKTLPRHPAAVRLYVNAGYFSTTRVTSPTWGPPPACKRALRFQIVLETFSRMSLECSESLRSIVLSEQRELLAKNIFDDDDDISPKASKESNVSRKNSQDLKTNRFSSQGVKKSVNRKNVSYLRRVILRMLKSKTFYIHYISIHIVIQSNLPLRPPLVSGHFFKVPKTFPSQITIDETARKRLPLISDHF